jgi:hypothetical protein
VTRDLVGALNCPLRVIRVIPANPRFRFAQRADIRQWPVFVSTRPKSDSVEAAAVSVAGATHCARWVQILALEFAQGTAEFTVADFSSVAEENGNGFKKRAPDETVQGLGCGLNRLELMVGEA